MKDTALENMIRLRYEGEGEFSAIAIATRELLDRKLIVGESYRIDIYNERSSAFHNKYFATIAEAWQHLPDPWDAILPSPTHLRKYALIKAGWCTVATYPLRSDADAIIAVSTAKMEDEYCLAVASGSVLTIYRAKSQRWTAQYAVEFYETAVRVFDVIGGIIGVDPLSLYDPKDYKPASCKGAPMA